MHLGIYGIERPHRQDYITMLRDDAALKRYKIDMIKVCVLTSTAMFTSGARVGGRQIYRFGSLDTRMYMYAAERAKRLSSSKHIAGIL